MYGVTGAYERAMISANQGQHPIIYARQNARSEIFVKNL